MWFIPFLLFCYSPPLHLHLFRFLRRPHDLCALRRCQWEAFTLGQATTMSNEFLMGKDQKDLTPAQRESLARNIDVVRTAGHQYLVQRWGDGTICDKTGRPREIEIQVCPPLGSSFECNPPMAELRFLGILVPLLTGPDGYDPIRQRNLDVPLHHGHPHPPPLRRARVPHPPRAARGSTHPLQRSARQARSGS